MPTFCPVPFAGYLLPAIMAMIGRDTFVDRETVDFPCRSRWPEWWNAGIRRRAENPQGKAAVAERV